MTATGTQALETLLAGNLRFRTGNSKLHSYREEQLGDLAQTQSPIAAILACSDSRVAPEVIFDQPLGTVFAARTPGNVNADSVKWMIQIAVEDLHSPLVLVVAHTGCLAVTQIVQGELTGPGGPLRAQISSALTRARSHNPTDLVMATVRENVYVTIERLSNESHELRKAMERGTTVVAGAVYDMHTGKVEVLPSR